MIDFRLQVKTDQFNQALREMGAKLDASGVTMQQVIDFEVARILEKTLQRTMAATKASITLSQEERPPWRTYDFGRGMKHYLLTNRYPDPLWRQIEQRLARSLARKIAAAGFAKQSWLALADILGFKIEAPGYVRQAKVGNVTNAANVGMQREFSAGKYTLYIEDNSPLLRWSDARQAFFSAVAGRTRYFYENLARGVFSDLQQVAARYPGLIVTVNTAGG